MGYVFIMVSYTPVTLRTYSNVKEPITPGKGHDKVLYFTNEYWDTDCYIANLPYLLAKWNNNHYIYTIVSVGLVTKELPPEFNKVTEQTPDGDVSYYRGFYHYD